MVDQIPHVTNNSWSEILRYKYRPVGYGYNDQFKSPLQFDILFGV